MSLLQEREGETEREMGSIFTVKKHRDKRESRAAFENSISKCPTTKKYRPDSGTENRNWFKNRPNVPWHSSPPPGKYEVNKKAKTLELCHNVELHVPSWASSLSVNMRSQESRMDRRGLECVNTRGHNDSCRTKGESESTVVKNWKCCMRQFKIDAPLTQWLSRRKRESEQRLKALRSSSTARSTNISSPFHSQPRRLKYAWRSSLWPLKLPSANSQKVHNFQMD